jgi:hypothetical protein
MCDVCACIFLINFNLHIDICIDIFHIVTVQCENWSLVFVFSCRYIELFPSTYDEAKRRIINDARSNARLFVGEDDDNKKHNNNKQYSRSQSGSRQRSRSTSRGNY